LVTDVRCRKSKISIEDKYDFGRGELKWQNYLKNKKSKWISLRLIQPPLQEMNM
jgi:hypothetical protein